MFTKHEMELSYKDGYEAGYEVGYEHGIRANENELDKSEFVFIVMSAIFGFAFAIGLCKFVPGFWEFISKGLI